MTRVGNAGAAFSAGNALFATAGDPRGCPRALRRRLTVLRVSPIGLQPDGAATVVGCVTYAVAWSVSVLVRVLVKVEVVTTVGANFRIVLVAMIVTVPPALFATCRVSVVGGAVWVIVVVGMEPLTLVDPY